MSRWPGTPVRGSVPSPYAERAALLIMFLCIPLGCIALFGFGFAAWQLLTPGLPLPDYLDWISTLGTFFPMMLYARSGPAVWGRFHLARDAGGAGRLARLCAPGRRELALWLVGGSLVFGGSCVAEYLRPRYDASVDANFATSVIGARIAMLVFFVMMAVLLDLVLDPRAKPSQTNAEPADPET